MSAANQPFYRLKAGSAWRLQEQVSRFCGRAEVVKVMWPQHPPLYQQEGKLIKGNRPEVEEKIGERNFRVRTLALAAAALVNTILRGMSNTRFLVLPTILCWGIPLGTIFSKMSRGAL